MAKVLMVDPPEGWKYGFPKPVPDNCVAGQDMTDWLVAQGYPRDLTEKSWFYLRFWETDVD